MHHLPTHELRHKIEETWESLKPKGDGPSVTKTLLLVLWGIFEQETENGKKLDTLLEKLMALDVTKLNDAAVSLATAAADLGTLATQLPTILTNASAADQAQLDPLAATVQTSATAITAAVAAIKAALPTPPAA